MLGKVIDYIHVVLFILLLFTPFIFSRDSQYSDYLYYWALFLIFSWGMNDGNCVLTPTHSSNNMNVKLLNNGPVVKVINDLGIQTSKIANYLIRVSLGFGTAGVLYYYSSRNHLQRLLVWCSCWMLFTMETLRHDYISNVGMEIPTFNSYLRTFKKENLNMFG